MNGLATLYWPPNVLAGHSRFDPDKRLIQFEVCKNNMGGIAGILCHHSDIKWASQCDISQSYNGPWGGSDQRQHIALRDGSRSGTPGEKGLSVT